MKILEKPNGRREECASLANIGYHMFEVNLEGEVYTYAIPGIEECCKAERRDELAMKCVKMFNQGMTYQAIADKLGFNSAQPVATLIGTHRDLITRKLPRRQDQRTKLDKTTIFSIYDEFTYTDKNNSELGRQYNVSDQLIYALRRGRIHSNLAREYITSKGLVGYWQGYNPPPK